MYIGFGIDIVTILVMTGLAVFLCVGIMIFRSIFFRAAGFGCLNFILEVLIILSFIVVLLITLSPIQSFQLSPVHMSKNLIPFVNIMEMFAFSTRSTILRMVGGNIVLFIPFSFFMTLRFLGEITFARIVLVGIILSIFIETLQLFHPFRQTNIDDIILNSLGVFLGACGALIIRKAFERRGDI